MPTEALVQIPPTGSGKKVRADSALHGGNTVLAEYMQLGPFMNSDWPAYSIVSADSALLADKVHLHIAPSTAMEIVLIKISHHHTAASALAYPCAFWLVYHVGATGVSGGTSIMGSVNKLDTNNAAASTYVSQIYDNGPTVVGATSTQKVASCAINAHAGQTEAILYEEKLNTQRFKLSSGVYTVTQYGADSVGSIDVTCIFRIRTS